MSNEPIPIEDDEVLFRRIPVSMNWFVDGKLYDEAFEPRRDEHTGISLFRKRFRTIDEVAKGKSKSGYYVASLQVSDLLNSGIVVVPKPDTPDGWDHAHAELPALNAKNRKSSEALVIQARLAALGQLLPIEGPFVTKWD